MRFDNVDFDADFDPTEHDRKMKELFNDEYYADAEEDMKPEFPEIDEELNIERTWDNYDPNVDEIDTAADSCEPHCEDPDFNVLYIFPYMYFANIFCTEILTNLFHYRWMLIIMNLKMYNQKSLTAQKQGSEKDVLNLVRL